MDIALATAPTLGNQQALAVLGEITNLLGGFHVHDNGADRHANGGIAACLAGHLPAHAVLAALGAKLALVAKIDQGVQAFVGDQPDAAAGRAITPIRTAKWNEFLAAKADAAIAAIAGLDANTGFIDELHDRESGIGKSVKE